MEDHRAHLLDPEPTPATRRDRLFRAANRRGVPLQTILVTVAVVAAAYLAALVVVRIRDIILLIVVSGFVALILNPVVVALQHWKVPRRGLAVAIVTIWGVIVFIGLAAAFGLPLSNAITHLAHALPGYIDDAEHGRGWIGRLVRRYNVQHWVQQNAPKLVNIGQDLAKPALSLGKGAFSLILELITIFILILLLLLEGPKMRASLLRNMVPSRAERWTRIAHQVSRSVTGYMLGNFLTSIIAGGVVLVTLLLLGVPFAFLWALWVALVDFLPLVGGALAGIPVVLFALGHSLTAGIVTLVVFLIYTQVENHILNPVVMSRTVKINPLLVLISILVGASIGSWIGGIFGAFVAALLAIPTAGAIQVLVLELWQNSAPPGSGGAARGGGAVPGDGADGDDGSAAGAGESGDPGPASPPQISPT